MLGPFRLALRSPLLRVAGSALGILLLVRSVDLRGVVHDAGHADPRWLAGALLLTLAAFGANVVEWGVLLRTARGDVRWRSVGSWQAQSVFFGHVIPSPAAGDGVRVVNASRVAGHGPGLASLLGSRMASSLGMAVWGLAGAIVLRSAFGVPVLVAGALYVALMLAAWVLALTAGGTVRRLAGRGGRVRRKVFGVVRPLTDGFHALRGRAGALLVSTVIASVGWGCNLVALDAFAHAVGVDVPVTLFAVAVPISLVATLSPVSINGMGLREGVMAGLLAHAGVSSAHAGTLSLLLDAQMLPVALTGGLLWMASRGRSPLRAAPAEADRALTVEVAPAG